MGYLIALILAFSPSNACQKLSKWVNDPDPRKFQACVDIFNKNMKENPFETRKALHCIEVSSSKDEFFLCFKEGEGDVP